MFAFVKMSILGLPLFLWIYILGFVVHFILVSRRYASYGLSYARSLALWAVVLVLSVVGGKAYEVVDNWFYYRHNMSQVLSLGGHGWNGVFICVVVGLVVAFRVLKLPMLKFLDAFAYYLPIGIIIGRMGCFLTADGDYGTPTSLPWGVTFEHGYFPTQVPVHPTPIYEGLVMLILFWALTRWVMDKTDHGWVLTIYLAVYSVERFLTEFIRWSKPFALGLTLPQWACLLYLVIAVVLGVFLLRRRRVPHETRQGVPPGP